jgi:hypothetical protein
MDYQTNSLIMLSLVLVRIAMFMIGRRIFFYLSRDLCHTRFSKEQNQANHMCVQEVHTYVRMKKNIRNNVII